MKKRAMNNVLAVALFVLIELLVGLVHILPWWFFVVPLFFAGLIIGAKKWNLACFMTGLISGFISWFGAGAYFGLFSESVMLSNLARLLGMNQVVVLIIMGLIGGLLSGLAVYSGKCILTTRRYVSLQD